MHLQLLVATEHRASFVKSTILPNRSSHARVIEATRATTKGCAPATKSTWKRKTQMVFAAKARSEARSPKRMRHSFLTPSQKSVEANEIPRSM